MAALSHLRVLDLSEHIAGQYCSRLLADFGAQVTLLEPPGGSLTRKIGPFRKADGSSLLFFHLNLGKRLRTFDHQTDDLTVTTDGADIILLPPGIDRSALRHALPQAVLCLISDFGEDGPLASWRGGEMIHQALSGIMYQNGAPNREPLYGCGHRVSYAAGTATYSAVLAAVIARKRTGRGDDVQIDVAETAASMSYNLANQFNYNGTYDRRADTPRTPMGTAKCLDGWITVFIYDYRWKETWRALGAPEMIDDPRFASAEERMRRWPEVVMILRRVVAGQKADDVVERLQAVGTSAARANAPQDLLNSPHLQARHYWQKIAQDGEERLALGPPFRLSATQWRLRSTDDEIHPRRGITLSETVT
jgi:crotonobetainyl-CoA:carnitine CoA-transferase CaiB-like acyl-CoA transferase